MWLRSFIVLFFLVLSNDGFAVKCENMLIDDFRFGVRGKDVSVSFLNERLSKSNLKINFVKTKNDSNRISGTIQLEDSIKVCNKINVDVDPIKLCRDENDNIEDWRFVTFGDSEILSVVSLSADVDDENVVLNKSRICRETTLVGRVYIEDSHLLGGNITGNPNVVATPEIPEIPDLPPESFKKSRNKDEDAPDPQYLNYYTVKMKKTIIDMNPSITGSNLGITMNEVHIHDSPTISGEISFERSDIRDDGFYSGESHAYFDGLFQPLVRDNLTGDDNEISGIYFLEREVTNSIIEGEVLLNSNNDLDMVAHIGPHNTTFYNSEFKGFGFIGAEIHEKTKIHGYHVPPITHGVIFEDGRTADTVTINGAVWLSGYVWLGSYITINGNQARQSSDLPLHIDNSDLWYYVNVSGSPRIFSSTVKENTTVSGNAYIFDSTVRESSVSCDGSVISAIIEFDDVDCGDIRPEPLSVPPFLKKTRSPYEIAARTVSRFKEKNLKSQKTQNEMELEAKKIEVLKNKMKARL